MPLLLFKLILLLSFPVIGFELPDEIILQTHQVYQIPLSANTQITVGHQSILDVRDRQNFISIRGKKMGHSFIVVKNKKISVIIGQKKIVKTYEQLKKWIHNKRGVKIHVSPEELTVGGRLLRLSDFLDFKNFTQTFNSFSTSASLSETLKNEIKSQIDQQVKGHDLRQGRLNFNGGWSYLIQTQDTKKIALYKKILEPYGIKYRINSLSHSGNPQIKIQIYICHVSRSFFQQFGVQWPASIQAQVGTPERSTNSSPWQAQVALHALEQKGLGKIIASPSLITMSHQKATFHSGGEYPIQNRRSLYSQIQWKKHGILLEALPKIDGSQNIELDLKLEVSILNHGQSAEGVPSVEKSEIHSKINLKNGQALILSGLIKNIWKNNQEGVPLLSQIPIFEPFFSHRSKGVDESDVVFVVEARIQP